MADALLADGLWEVLGRMGARSAPRPWPRSGPAARRSDDPRQARLRAQPGASQRQPRDDLGAHRDDGQRDGRPASETDGRPRRHAVDRHGAEQLAPPDLARRQHVDSRDNRPRRHAGVADEARSVRAEMTLSSTERTGLRELEVYSG
jgi:hypothetical protein